MPDEENEVWRRMLSASTAGLGVQLTQRQLEQFSILLEGLQQAQAQTNVTAVTGVREIVLKHFVDSLSCWPVLSAAGVRSVIDIGSGAGFPGLPLAIVGQGLIKVTLVESNGKKCQVIQRLIEAVGLDNAWAVCQRAEEFASLASAREQYDAVVIRAVSSLAVIVEYGLPFLRVGGIMIAMKGPEVQEELAAATNALEALGGECQDVMTLALPEESGRRSLVVVGKVRATPAKFPRRAGMAKKRPL